MWLGKIQTNNRPHQKTVGIFYIILNIHVTLISLILHFPLTSLEVGGERADYPQVWLLWRSGLGRASWGCRRKLQDSYSKSKNVAFLDWYTQPDIMVSYDTMFQLVGLLTIHWFLLFRLKKLHFRWPIIIPPFFFRSYQNPPQMLWPRADPVAGYAPASSTSDW